MKKSISSQPKMIKSSEKIDKNGSDQPKVPPIDLKKMRDNNKDDDLIDLEKMQNEKQWQTDDEREDSKETERSGSLRISKQSLTGKFHEDLTRIKNDHLRKPTTLTA